MIKIILPDKKRAPATHVTRFRLYSPKNQLLLYSFLKFSVTLFRCFFFRSIRVDHPEFFQIKGPVLIAANHPNSFLDAILLDTLFQQPVWSLARGDVFKNNFLTRVLTAMRILPVYRVSEGVENLSTNYETFATCKKIFRDNGLVLIFSEGLCINEWHLRPLKKGTARLVISSWKEEIPLTILPVGINYSSFTRFGKNVIINIGEPISKNEVSLEGTEGQSIQSFNSILNERLQPLVLEISPEDQQTRNRLFAQPSSKLRSFILAIPSFTGWLLHQPLYLPLKKIALRKAKSNGHYDSVLAALLFVSYPLYLITITVLIQCLTGNSFLTILVLLMLPLTAFAFTRTAKH